MQFVRYDKAAFRYVEKQSQIATSEFVDTQAEQVRLEELLEQSKPPLADDLQAVHWLLRSAFRYPPLEYGSRFGRMHERGILYLSETRRALQAEAAFYAYKFYQDMAQALAMPIKRECTVLRIKLKTFNAVDLNAMTQVTDLVNPDSWAASQIFGSRARDAAAQLIRYPSARIPSPANANHCNLAALSPAVVASKTQPRACGSYTMLVDQAGVRIQGELQATHYIAAETLRSRPFT